MDAVQASASREKFFGTEAVRRRCLARVMQRLENA
jgi:hypothetical protein